MITDSTHAEVAFFSSLFTEPTLLNDVNTVINIEMFSSIPHKNLYKEILEIKDGGYTPEYSFLVSTLVSKNLLDSCGGADYLDWVKKQSVDSDNFQAYINQIIDNYKTRELIKISGSIAESISTNQDVSHVIDALKLKLDQINSSVLESVSGIKEISKGMWEDLKERINSEEKIATSTSILKLDSVTGGFIGGDLWIIAGRPGTGKTAFMCNTVLQNQPSLVFSLEMNKRTLAQRLVAINSGVPIFKIRMGTINQEQLESVAKSLEYVQTLPIYIDDTYDISLPYVISTIRKYHKLYGIKVVHLDYIQLLAKRSADAVHDLGNISRAFKKLSNDLDITCVIYSQLNRGVESRDDKRPMLSDLRQSGNLEEDTDIAVFLYRDVIYNQNTKNKDEFELIIRKHRNGSIGTLFVKFDEQTNKITEER